MLDVTAAKLIGRGESNRELVLTGRDVTERRRLEGQLRQSQKMESIGRLAGGVAHDFNNLLTAIIGFSELLLEELTPDGRGRADLEAIQKAAAHGATLTRQLLAFSRRQVQELKILDLNALVRDIEPILRRLLGEDIVVDVVTDEELRLVKVDRGQIEQVLINLVVNARDAMPHGGNLRIETHNVLLDAAYLQRHPYARVGHHVVLTVSDNGVGMDADVRGRVFEPFFTTKELGKGTGLGLSMVYGIVKQSGGHIELQSEPGAGSQFRVYLPAVEDVDGYGAGGAGRQRAARRARRRCCWSRTITTCASCWGRRWSVTATGCCRRRRGRTRWNTSPIRTWRSICW